MVGMKAKIVFQTTNGNNRAIAERFRKNLVVLGHDVSMHNVYDVLPEELVGADLYVFTAPTHMQRAPRRIRSFLKKLAKSGWEVRYALVATRLPGSKGDHEPRTLDMMASSFTGPGHVRMGGLFIDSKTMKGPLESGWEAKVDAFLADILSRL